MEAGARRIGFTKPITAIIPITAKNIWKEIMDTGSNPKHHLLIA